MSAYKLDIEPFETDFEFEDTLEPFGEFAEEAQDTFPEYGEEERSSFDPESADLLPDELPVDEAESWAWEAVPEFELLPETAAVRSSRAGEQYVDTSTWNADPLRAHGGTGANVLLRWNDVPSDTRSIDVVVHLHGYCGLPPNAQMLRAVAARSGLDLSGRTRPTLAILPRGRRITREEVQKKQALLNERARQSGKKPATARSDVYTFPALLRDDGAGLAALINAALQWFARTVLSRGAGATVPIARLILTAHSGGGAALDRLVALHARRKLCNPDEVQAFDALYSQANGLKSWVSARLRADRGAAGYGGGLRVLYRGGTQRWSEDLARLLPARGHALSRRYRAECTRVGHLEIPNAFGPALLRDAAADIAALQPCSGGAPSKPATSKSSRPKQSRSSTPARSGAGTRIPGRAALPSNVAGWIRSTDRSALELVADESQRRKLLQEIDWSREYFRGNPDASGNPAPGRLGAELFNAMAHVVPERRVPYTLRFHDVTRVVEGVPGEPDHKLFPEARDAFVRMREAAAADGVQLRITSSWRSLGRQQAARKKQGNPLAVARGTSAHMYGLAVDLNMRVPGLSLVNASTRAHDKMANIVRMYRSPIYKWLALNGSRFGWFPYRREPWHWEYNPQGFKERFEGSSAVSREFDLEAAPHERSSAGSLWTPVCSAAPRASFSARQIESQ